MKQVVVWLVCWLLGLGLALVVFGVFLLSGGHRASVPVWEGTPFLLQTDLSPFMEESAVRRSESPPAVPELGEDLPDIQGFTLPPAFDPALPEVSLNWMDTESRVLLPDAADLPVFPAGNSASGEKGLSGSIVYGPGELDEIPYPVHRVIPPFPQAARRQGIRQGRVRLLLEVDSSGRVREIQVLEADPPGYFEGVSVDAVKRWRFTPGKVDGLDVRTRFELPIQFGDEKS
ncbi:energy transducer TonB [Desulfobotulus sp. H1]|uniref:Energy transducer TonB n=1 Tax=Desulfobotulus pelophilus TaxID=2823377 RepID=A0ABT3N4X1_9BACT|nr:energy transducer TonB [Desulfobotulus pelophilus]